MYADTNYRILAWTNLRKICMIVYDSDREVAHASGMECMARAVLARRPDAATVGLSRIVLTITPLRYGPKNPAAVVLRGAKTRHTGRDRSAIQAGIRYADSFLRYWFETSEYRWSTENSRL